MFQEQTPVTITWVRIGLFSCSMLLVTLAVFSNRSHFRVGHGSQPSADEAAAPAGLADP